MNANIINEVKAGDTIKLVSGAYYPELIGIAYGKTTGKFGTSLRVKVTDENGKVEFHWVSNVKDGSEKSIGAYRI